MDEKHFHQCEIKIAPFGIPEKGEGIYLYLSHVFKKGIRMYIVKST